MSQLGSRSVVSAMGGREWIMLLTLAILWGGSFFFFKVMLVGLPAFAVVLGRVGLAAIILNAWLLFQRDFMPTTFAAWRDFVFMGMLNNVIPYSLIVFGEQRISSGLASILNATTPIFAVLIAHWLTANEKLSGLKICGIIMGFLGVFVLVGPNSFFQLNSSDTTGDVACLLAAVSYAFAGVFGRRFKGMAPIKVATGQITASTLVLVPIVIIFERPWTLPMPDANVWAAMFGIALLSTVLAYILYFSILETAGATNVLLVTFLLPVSALFLGWGVLGEDITARSLVGMAIIGLGLAAIDGRLFRNVRKLRLLANIFARSDEQQSVNFFEDGGGI